MSREPQSKQRQQPTRPKAKGWDHLIDSDTLDTAEDEVVVISNHTSDILENHCGELFTIGGVDLSDAPRALDRKHTFLYLRGLPKSLVRVRASKARLESHCAELFTIG